MRKDSRRELKEISVMLDDFNRPYISENGTGFYVEDSKKHNSPEEIYRFARHIDLHKSAVEKVYMLLLDAANHILSECMISQGSVDRSLMPEREVCQTALLGGAVGVALIHNHPSSEVSPSDIDIGVTRKIQKALRGIGVKLLDHVIVGRDGYFSFLREGLLKDGDADV